ncbi:hypothetical protein JL720_4739 [Aureococcus anophagefferens]|nr:hypothetical protein JL720_4739 [Aureococcus anophagefferens]
MQRYESMAYAAARAPSWRSSRRRRGAARRPPRAPRGPAQEVVGEAAAAAAAARREKTGAAPPAALAPVWTVDGHGDDCSLCGKLFTLFDRKHHCRKCGRLVCHACSGEKLLLPDADARAGESFQRACVTCHAAHVDGTAYGVDRVTSYGTKMAPRPRGARRRAPPHEHPPPVPPHENDAPPLPARRASTIPPSRPPPTLPERRGSNIPPSRPPLTPAARGGAREARVREAAAAAAAARGRGGA